MPGADIKLKQLYDATVNTIIKLHMQKGTLSMEEMHCLLSLLDQVIMGIGDPGLSKLLRQWQAGVRDEEVDAIIKATVLGIDFADNDSLRRNMEIIQGLLLYNNKLKDS